EAGNIIGAINTLLDLRTQTLGDEARMRLAAIVASSMDAIVSKDMNGIITSWNDAAERLFGYTSAEAIGRPVTILIPPDRLDEEVSIISRIRAGERVPSYETMRLRKDGTLVSVSLTVSPIRDAIGRVVGASK
ncbi:MAG: PAS domain S-box protein, partial [Mesorhizobium sp.]